MRKEYIDNPFLLEKAAAAFEKEKRDALEGDYGDDRMNCKRKLQNHYI